MSSYFFSSFYTHYFCKSENGYYLSTDRERPCKIIIVEKGCTRSFLMLRSCDQALNEFKLGGPDVYTGADSIPDLSNYLAGMYQVIHTFRHTAAGTINKRG